MPDSGSSFLANYIAELGFFLGNPRDIQGVTGMHPKGTGEHLRISHETWGLLDKKRQIKFYPGDKLPSMPLALAECKAARDVMGEIIKRQGVQLVKDCSAPWTYLCYPESAEFVIITRNWRNMTKKFLEYIGYEGLTKEDIQHGWVKWQSVCLRGIKQNRRWYQVGYEDFATKEGRETELAKLCKYLGVEIPTGAQLDTMNAVYCPGGAND